MNDSCNSDKASVMEEQLLKDLFKDKYIEDNGFSEQLYLKFNKSRESNIRLSRFIATFVILVSIVVGSYFILVSTSATLTSFDVMVFIGMILFTTVLSMETEI